MTISENKLSFIELAGCSFFGSTPVHGGGGGFLNRWKFNI